MVSNGRITPCGHLVAERVASMAIDWPSWGFLRIEPGPATLRIVVTAPMRVPVMPAAVAVARAIQRETRDVISFSPSLVLSFRPSLSTT